MQEQDALTNQKSIKVALAAIATVGITTAIFILTPKISALIEYNSLASQIRELPANSQLKTLAARKQTIQEITSLIEQIKNNNQKRNKQETEELIIAETKLEALSRLVREDEKITKLFEVIPSELNSQLNSSSSSTRVERGISKLQKNTSILENIENESVFSYRQAELDSKILAYQQELEQLEKLKQIVKKRELKEKREREAKAEQKRLAREKAQQERQRKRDLALQKDSQIVRSFLNGVKQDLASLPYNQSYLTTRTIGILSYDHPWKETLREELPKFFSQTNDQQSLNRVADALGSNYIYIYCVERVTYSLGNDLFNILNKRCESFLPVHSENTRIFFGY